MPDTSTTSSPAGLAARARQAAVEVRQQSDQATADRVTAHAAALAKTWAERTGWVFTPAGGDERQTPYLLATQYGADKVLWGPEARSFVTVEDVRLVHSTRFGRDEDLFVVGPCGSCGAPDARHLAGHSGSAEVHRSRGIRIYGEVPVEQARERFTLAVGRALESGFMCDPCRAGLPKHCPTCGRNN